MPTGRHDYRDPARRKYGKQTVSYPEGSLEHPVITESFSKRKDGGGGALAFLTASVRSATAFLTRQSSTAGDDDSTNVTAVYETLPGPWKEDHMIDPDSLGLVVQRHRKNIGANIRPGAVIYTGSGGTVTCTISGGAVNACTVTGGGTGYGEIVALVFSAPPTGGRVAQGYARSTDGALTSVVMTDRGAGYVSAPTVTVLPGTLVCTERHDMDALVAQEVVSVLPQPAARDIESAIVRVEYRQQWFPSRLDVQYAMLTKEKLQALIQADARLVEVDILTYFVMSDTKPVVDIDQIIPCPSITVNTLGNPISKVGDFSEVLIDECKINFKMFNSSNIYQIRFPASTPSFREYEGRKYLSGSVSVSNASDEVVGTGTAFSTEVEVGDIFRGKTVTAVTNDTHFTVDSEFDADDEYFPGDPWVRRPSEGWLGNPKIFGGDVAGVRYQKLWKIELVRTIAL